MGVYIPNMDKPKRCANCEYADEDWWCNFNLDLSYANEKEQYEHCPLIEIDLVKCEDCEWSNGECSVGERYQGGCTFGKNKKGIDK